MPTRALNAMPNARVNLINMRLETVASFDMIYTMQFLLFDYFYAWPFTPYFRVNHHTGVRGGKARSAAAALPNIYLPIV